jgi:hypothetical protein
VVLFTALNIRKFVVKAALFLDASVAAGLNVVVSGGTQAVKPACP